jgi:hypothetical protein
MRCREGLRELGIESFPWEESVSNELQPKVAALWSMETRDDSALRNYFYLLHVTTQDGGRVGCGRGVVGMPTPPHSMFYWVCLSLFFSV